MAIRRLTRICHTAVPASDRVQGVGKVGDEVVGIFDTDRDPNQVVADSERRLALIRDRQVSHRRRRAGQGLGAAKADRQVRDRKRVEEGEGLLLAP